MPHCLVRFTPFGRRLRIPPLSQNARSSSTQPDSHSSVEFMFAPEWSKTDHLQRNNRPDHVYAVEPSKRTQLQWLDEAQYLLKGYHLETAFEALDAARSCPDADPTLQRQLLLDMVLFCKQKKGELAMEACVRMLERYPMFATDPVGQANLGIILAMNRDHARAIRVLEKVPRDHPIWKDQAASWLAESYSLLGEHAKAEPIIASVCARYTDLDEAHVQQELARAEENPMGLDLHEHGWTCLRIKNLQLWAGILMQLEKNAQAVAVMEKAVKEGIRISGHEDAITASAKNVLGLALIRSGRFAEAIQPLEEGTKFLEERLTEGDSSLRTSIDLLRAYCARLRRYADAHRHALRHRAMTVKLYGKASEKYATSTMHVARHLMQLGKYAEAIGELSAVENRPSQSQEVKKLLEKCVESVGRR